jgi:site-specific DNA-methyltransferase (cytosine-N4-specific)
VVGSTGPADLRADREKLNRVDWTFLDADTRTHTHGIHSYPAKFIPQIPRELISKLHPGDNSLVLDPFCGSGTTLVEASLARVDAIGIDLSPIAALIAKVKTTPLAEPLVPAAKAISARSRSTDYPIPNIPRLDHWFVPPVQRALAAILGEIGRLENSITTDALRVALSSIIVRVSNQESDTRYAAIPKRIQSDDVFMLFERAVESLEGALLETWGASGSQRSRVRVLNRDVLEVEPHEIGSEVSLVVTSPPYPNAYEYWLYHKYRMYWLGMDPIAVREREIGARPHYFRKNPQTEHDFERQMGVCFRLLSRVIRRGGYACFLIGRSIIGGRTIDNEAILGRAAASAGFTAYSRHLRTIPSTRKAFNPSHGTIREEGLLVFRQQG